MPNTEENLRQALANAQRLQQQAEAYRMESELLLSGMQAILKQEQAEQIYADMFAVFDQLIPYDLCFVLEAKPGDLGLVCRASTEDNLLGLVWQVDDILARALAGQSCSVISVKKQKAWQQFEHQIDEGSPLKAMMGGLHAALYSKIELAGTDAILVFCHRDKGIYKKQFLSMVQRFSALTAQTMVSVRKHKLELERIKLVDEKERAEKGLIQAEKMASVGLLAAGVAHEINNPIGYISSNVNYLQESQPAFNEANERSKALIERLLAADLPADLQAEVQAFKQWHQSAEIDILHEDFSDILHESRSGITKVSDIVNSLRTFSRADDSVLAELDVNKLIESTLKIVNIELKYQCQIRCDLRSSQLVKAGEGKLSQVFANLIINAGQAMQEHGLITITSFDDGDKVVVKVSDTGCGIAADKLSAVFDPFYTTKQVGEGTGLGLSISYNIIQEFGGRLSVESEEGVGTCFTMRLPALS